MDHLILNVPDGFVDGSSAPVWLGCAIIVEASVVQVWGTSTEIVVRVFTDPHMQPIAANRDFQRILLASAFFVFCGMKITDPASGKSVCPKMPAFALQNAAEKIASQFADLRRKARLSKQAMVEKAQCGPTLFNQRVFFVQCAMLTFWACTASQSITNQLTRFHLPIPLTHPSTASQLVNPCCSMCISSCHRMRITWATCLEAFTWSARHTHTQSYCLLLCQPNPCFSSILLNVTCAFRWAEEIALLSARRHTSLSRGNAVGVGFGRVNLQCPLPLRLFTAYIDQVTFKDKGEVGDRIMLTSQCCRSFGGILEIEVKAEAYKAHEQPRLINVAYFCVSGVDGCGKPLLFADVIPETEDERSRFTMSQVLLLI
jgi:acyl-CoA hydrolase